MKSVDCKERNLLWIARIAFVNVQQHIPHIPRKVLRKEGFGSAQSSPEDVFNGVEPPWKVR